MPLWLKYTVLGIVCSAWLAFLVVSFVQHQAIPIAVWTVPGATYAVLSDKIGGVTFGGGNVSVRRKREEDDDDG